jgi:hypothetical protein
MLGWLMVDLEVKFPSWSSNDKNVKRRKKKACQKGDKATQDVLLDVSYVVVSSSRQRAIFIQQENHSVCVIMTLPITISSIQLS